MHGEAGLSWPRRQLSKGTVVKCIDNKYEKYSCSPESQNLEWNLWVLDSAVMGGVIDFERKLGHGTTIETWTTRSWGGWVRRGIEKIIEFLLEPIISSNIDLNVEFEVDAGIKKM
jgi:hypothetical protein